MSDQQTRENLRRWWELKTELDQIERELVQQEEHKVTIYGGDLRPIADKTVTVGRNLLTNKLEWPTVNFENLPDCHIVFVGVDGDYPLPLRAEKTLKSGDTLVLDVY